MSVAKLSVRAAARTPSLTRQTCRFSSEAAAEAHERGCGSRLGSPAVEEKTEAASEASGPEDVSADDAHESLSAWDRLQQVWRVRVCMHVGGKTCLSAVGRAPLMARIVGHALVQWVSGSMLRLRVQGLGLGSGFRHALVQWVSGSML